jgi:GNAT superfamily N-acetyltransferase
LGALVAFRPSAAETTAPGDRTRSLVVTVPTSRTVSARPRSTGPTSNLVVVTEADECAAYALCWYDPVTRVGLVEQMRTEEDHQRPGLARHLLTAGVRRLVDLGADRIRISWEADNPARRPSTRMSVSSRRNGCTPTLPDTERERPEPAG